MYYVYEYHLSGKPYITIGELPYDELCCETCGDSDSYLAEFETEEEALNFINGLKYDKPDFTKETGDDYERGRYE